MRNRKLIKPFIAIALNIIIVLTVTSFALAQGVVIKGVPDGQNKSTLMDEHFYSGSLEPNFTSDTVSVTTDSYGMHFSGAYHYGSALVLASYKLKNYNRFTFSVDLLESNGGFIYCGFGGADEKTTVSKYDFNLCVSRGVTAIYEMGGMDNWKSRGNKPLSNALTAGKTTNFAVTLERVSGNDFKILFEILEDGQPVVSTDYEGLRIRMDHPNGHFCMWGGQSEVFDLRDFKVYDSPSHLAFSDNFEHSSITYGDEAVGNSYWHTNEARFKSDEVFISRNAGPQFILAGDTITAKSKLAVCDKVSKPYEISFKAEITDISKNSTFGLFLGAPKSSDIKNATVIGVSANDSTSANVNLIKKGKITDVGDNTVPLSALNIDDSSVDFEVVIYSDYRLDFSVGGVKFSFKDVKYDGYWGICSYSSDNRGASVVRLDEVKVIRNTYKDCAQPDLSNDFAGIKITQDGFEEYYISDRTYYIGPGVSLRPKGAFTTEPSLYFENAGSYSSFTPKKPYTDFILQFDVKMVSEGRNSQWFGVSFGKESYATIADRSTSVNFEYYAWGTAPYTQMATNLCEFDDGTHAKKIEGYHFYKDQDTKYNFMIVAKNRTVYVYFKEDSEDISKLGICRAIIPNVNTAGYVSVFGLNSISFDIFNYKLTNLAPEATKDSDIALRETFNNKNLSDKLTLSGAAEVKEKALQLSGGALEMKNQSRYFISNMTLLKSGADTSVSFGGNKAVTVSKDLKKITVNDSGKKVTYDVSSYNLSDYKNTQLQMTVQYDALSIAAKGVYEPTDKFASPIVEYTFAKPVADGVIKWSSDDAIIDNVAVYALDHSYKAASVSYEQDPNDTDIWGPKANFKPAVSGNASSSSGISTVFIIIYAVLGAAVLALAGVIITMAVRKRGKKQ